MTQQIAKNRKSILFLLFIGYTIAVWIASLLTMPSSQSRVI